jgi:hypothetical protein
MALLRVVAGEGERRTELRMFVGFHNMPCLQRTFTGWNLTQCECNHKVSETEMKEWEYEATAGQEIKQIRTSLRYKIRQQF